MKCWLFDSGDGWLPLFAETRNKAALILQKYYMDTGDWVDYMVCKADLKRQKSFDQYANLPGVSTYDDMLNKVPNEAWLAAGYSINNLEEQ